MRRFKGMLGCLLALCAVWCSACNDDSTGDEAALQLLLDKAVVDYGVVGAVAGIATPAGTLVAASGYADPLNGIAMTPDLQVRIASVTKAIVATLVMRLVEQGVLALDDTVARWLPAAPIQGSDQITLRMLLSHTSGICDYEDAIEFTTVQQTDPTRTWTDDEVLAIAAGCDPYFLPGQGWHYSNTNYYLLGMIVEAAAGESVEALAERLIFAPVGATRSAITRTGELAPPYANDYAIYLSGGAIADVTGWNLSWDWTAGSAVTTVADMLAWSTAVIGDRIVSAATLAEMMTPVAPSTDDGLGFFVAAADPTLGEPVITHAGKSAGYAAIWAAFPQSGRSIFFAINRYDGVATPQNEQLDLAQEAILQGLKDIVAQP